MKNKALNLENIPKENIFKVPEKYFDELSIQIQVKTVEQINPIHKIIWSKKRTWISIAACTAFGILGYFVLIPQHDSLENLSLIKVQNQEIIEYLIQENLNQVDFAEQINGVKILKFKESEMIDNLKVSDKDILQSVDFENIDSEI